MTPTEKHRETAAAVAENSFLRGGLPIIDAIATALAKAEREGREDERKRCVDILEAVGRGSYGSAGTGIAIGAILSEAGESE